MLLCVKKISSLSIGASKCFKQYDDAIKGELEQFYAKVREGIKDAKERTTFFLEPGCLGV